MIPRRTRRAAAATVALFATSAPLALLSGCANAPHPDAAEPAVARATGVGAVVFRAEAGTLDEVDPVGAELPLGEAVRRAVLSDPGLHAALARVRAASADAQQARLLPNPVLNLIARGGTGKPQFEVSLTEDLLRVLQTGRRASAADHRLRQSAADAVTVALDLVAEVQERYVLAQSLEALRPVLQERRGLIERMAETARARLEAQEGARSDLTGLEAQRVELDVDLAETRRKLQEERLHLARLVGQPSAAADWVLEAWTPPVLGSGGEAAWVDAALRNRPEVQSISWSLAALGDDEALARQFPWEGSTAGVDAQYDSDWFAGPSVSTPIPIFDGGQARRARARAERLEAGHSLVRAKRKVVEEVRIAYRALEASDRNLTRIRSELVPLRQQRREQAEDSYRAGQTDVTPLLLAEQDLRAARERVVENELQVSLSLLRLQRAVGGPGVAATVSNPSTAGTPEAGAHSQAGASR